MAQSKIQMKKLISLLIAVSMLVCVFTACSSKDSAEPTEDVKTSAAEPAQESTPVEETAPEEASSAPAEDIAQPEEEALIFTGDAILAPVNDMTLPLVDEVVTYDLFFAYPPPLAEKIDTLLNGPALQELTERTNVSIEFYAVSAAVASERYSIMLASGDYPDILQDLLNNYSEGYDQAIEDGIIYDHLELIDEYIPIYSTILSQSEEIRLSLTTADGNIGCISRLYKEPSKSKVGNIVRQDWLDELGLDMPNTVSELTDVLTAFKTQLDVPEPYYMYCTGVSSNFSLCGAFGASYDYYQQDGVVKAGAIQDEFKAYLEEMNRWYNDGLISPDYLSNASYYPDSGKVADGTVGVFLQEDSFLQDVQGYVTDSGSTLSLKAMPSLIMNEGDVNHFGSGYGEWTGGTAWSISCNCEDPEPLCRMINYLFTAEGSLLGNYGVEGVSWDYGEDGQPHVNEAITANPEMGNSEAQLKYTLPFALFVEDYSRFDTGYTQDQLDAPGIWETNADHANVLPTGLTMSAQYADEYNSLYNDISTYISENTNKFITGARPISEFDDYVAQVEAMGIDRCVEIWQELLNEYTNK